MRRDFWPIACSFDGIGLGFYCFRPDPSRSLGVQEHLGGTCLQGVFQVNQTENAVVYLGRPRPRGARALDETGQQEMRRCVVVGVSSEIPAVQGLGLV